MLKEIKNKKYYIIRGLLTFTIFYSAAYLQYIPIKLFQIDVNNLTDLMKALLSTYSSIIVLFILYFLYRKDLLEEFQKFRKNFIKNMDIGVQCWIIGLVIMMITNTIITFVFKAGGANNENAVQAMIKAQPLLMLLDAGIIAPFNEELVFRKTLKDVFGKYKWLFVGLSFLLFGGAHVINSASVWTDYLYIIPYGALGASFAYAYYKTDTVFTSMSMHIIHNTVLVLLSILPTLIH